MIHVFDNHNFRKLLLAYPAKAIEMLYERHYRYLHALAANLTHDTLAATDIVQEALITIWENHKRLGRSHDQPIEHYLIRVIRNQCSKYVRQQQKRQTLRVHLNGHTRPYENTVEANLIKAEAARNLRSIIATFPPREKECLLMRIDQQLSIREIAARLNIKPKAVERNLTSARGRLRKRWLEQLQEMYK